MKKGKVKWFNSQKGFGFIESEEGQDVFVHHTGIIKNGGFAELKEGDVVTFEIQDTDKGKKAINVKLVQFFANKYKFIKKVAINLAAFLF